MSILSWPTNVPLVTREFRLRPFNISSVAAQTQELIPGGLLLQRWECKLVMSQIEEEVWRDIDGLIADLAGTGGLVRVWDIARTEPYFNQAVTRTVETFDDGTTFSDGSAFVSGPLPPFVTTLNGASRGDQYMVLQGFPASTEAVLRRGDLMEVRPNGIPADHGHLYLVTRTSRSNAAGQAGVYFKGGLHRGVAAGDMVVIGGGGMYPSTVFRLSSDSEGGFSISGAMIGDGTLSLTEVLPHT